MHPVALSILCCPFCDGDLRVAGKQPTKDELEFAVLSCNCGRYPVVAGIPIMKREEIGTNRRTINELNALIDAGKHREALVAALMPREPHGAQLAPSWIQALPSIRGFGRIKDWSGHWRLPRWREE